MKCHCLEILEKIPESSVDLVFADPPCAVVSGACRRRLSNGGINYDFVTFGSEGARYRVAA
jgi:DNA modification methylase